MYQNSCLEVCTVSELLYKVFLLQIVKHTYTIASVCTHTVTYTHIQRWHVYTNTGIRKIAQRMHTRGVKNVQVQVCQLEYSFCFQASQNPVREIFSA